MATALRPCIRRILVIVVRAAVQWAPTGGTIAYWVAIEARSDGLRSSALDQSYELLAAYTYLSWRIRVVGPPLIDIRGSCEHPVGGNRLRCLGWPSKGVTREEGTVKRWRRRALGIGALTVAVTVITLVAVCIRLGHRWSLCAYAWSCRQPLADYCGQDCRSYSAVDPDCDGKVDEEVRRDYPVVGWVSKCGTYYVVRDEWQFEGSGVPDTYWYFDATGELVAVWDNSDTNDFCSGKASSAWYGRRISCLLSDDAVLPDCNRMGIDR